MAFALILASCVLAPWLEVDDTRPVHVALPNQLAANWRLLVFCLAGFTGIAHAVRFATRPPAFLSTVPVKSRGRTTWVDVAAIDLIETQGNYLALHEGSLNWGR
jgi:hypothetical protein